MILLTLYVYRSINAALFVLLSLFGLPVLGLAFRELLYLVTFLLLFLGVSLQLVYQLSVFVNDGRLLREVGLLGISALQGHLPDIVERILPRPHAVLVVSTGH